jgi:hypothetical protein
VRKPRGKARKLVVPIALTVATLATTITVVATAVSVVTTAGCGGDDSPHADAGVDTPLI